MVKSWCRLVCLSGKKIAAPLSKVFLTSSFSIFIGMKLLSPISTTAHTKGERKLQFKLILNLMCRRHNRIQVLFDTSSSRCKPNIPTENEGKYFHFQQERFF